MRRVSSRCIKLVSRSFFQQRSWKYAAAWEAAARCAAPRTWRWDCRRGHATNTRKPPKKLFSGCTRSCLREGPGSTVSTFIQRFTILITSSSALFALSMFARLYAYATGVKSHSTNLHTGKTVERCLWWWEAGGCNFVWSVTFKLECRHVRVCQTTFLFGKVFFFFFFFLVSRDAESQKISSISCFLNFVIDFAFFCVW